MRNDIATRFGEDLVSNKEREMKMNRLVILAIMMILFSSCAVKVPNPQNSSNGILALSVKATNSSSAPFSRYYKIFSSLDPEVVITIYPSVGQTFVFSPELPPGEYYFDKVKSILDGQVARSNSNRKISTISDIKVTIKAGAVTIAGKRMNISKKRTGPHTTRSNWNFKTISGSEMSALVGDFKKLENSNRWVIANSH